DREFRLETVFRSQSVVGLFEKIAHIGLQDRCFVFVKLHFEMRRIEADEINETIHQHERVIRPLIERVAFFSCLESSLAFIFLSNPHQVDAYRAHRLPVLRIYQKGFPPELDSLFVEAQGNAVLGKRIEQFAVERVDLEDFLNVLIRLDERVDILRLSKEIDGSKEADRLRVLWI